MKKKNLLILLLILFVVALFSIATINMTFNLIDNDILYISWDYEDYEGFKLSESMYELEAVGVSDDNYPVSDGNQLIWTIRNLDSEDENVYGEMVRKTRMVAWTIVSSIGSFGFAFLGAFLAYYRLFN